MVVFFKTSSVSISDRRLMTIFMNCNVVMLIMAVMGIAVEMVI